MSRTDPGAEVRRSQRNSKTVTSGCLLCRIAGERHRVSSEVLWELEKVYNTKAFDQTVRIRLHAAHFRARKTAKKPAMTAQQKQVRHSVRHRWCRQHLRWNRREWQTVMFTGPWERFLDWGLRVHAEQWRTQDFIGPPPASKVAQVHFPTSNFLGHFVFRPQKKNWVTFPVTA